MNLTLKIAIMFLAVAMFATTGCKKKEEPTPDASIQASEDNSQMEGEFNSVYDFAEDIGDNQPGIGSGKTNRFNRLPACATITELDTLGPTKRLTVNFNPDTSNVTGGCLCHDGRTRKGSIKMEFTGRMSLPGSTVKAILQDNYYVYLRGAWVKHTGTKEIKNESQLGGNLKFRNTVTNAAAVIPNNGGTISWNAIHTLEKTAGTSTWWDISDDKYEIGGSSNGTNRQGHNFNTTITQNMKLKTGCRFIYAGKWTLTNTTTNQSMELNYDPIGGEPCDDIADVTFTSGGQTQTKRITL